MMHDWWSDGWMGGGMLFGGLFMLLVWGLVIAALVLLIRYLVSSEGRERSVEESPREILDRRFAKGEIDKDEYEARRKALGV
jgi:putative membrane protein